MRSSPALHPAHPPRLPEASNASAALRRPTGLPPLYRPDQEHDACGVGFVATLSGAATHEVLELALRGLENLTHRGAVGADARTGDGAGVLFELPSRFFAREAARHGFEGFGGQKGWRDAPADDQLAVGMVFLPELGDDARRCRERLNAALAGRGLEALFWREVPVRRDVLGGKAEATCPRIEQVVVRVPARLEGDEADRRLYVARREVERWADAWGLEGFYAVSLSRRTIVYKGLLVAHQLAPFYQDLNDPLFETRFTILHQRYSTNTFPNWVLAQPFRMLAHNGEINTLQGNRNWMRAREARLASPAWGARASDLRPVVQPGGSDSASLDNVLECLVLSGRDPLHAMAMLVPEAWEAASDIPSAVRDFYEYHACVSEPWDGPAALTFTDGRVVGAALDRNGLRPARYAVTADDLVVLGSEAGMVPLGARTVVEKGRLGPGQMIAVDVEAGALLRNGEIKDGLARRRPYGAWVRAGLLRLGRGNATPQLALEWPSTNGTTSGADRNGGTAPDGRQAAATPEAGSEPEADPGRAGRDLTRRQVLFGCTREELSLVLAPMARQGAEPVGSMGDDTALPPLAGTSRLLPHWFKQKFAQVTNPAIDSIRERLVMSLDVYLGPRRTFLEETPDHARLVHLPSPVLRRESLEALLGLGQRAPAAALDATFGADEGPDGLERALDRISAEAERAVDGGVEIVVLSDRAVGERQVPVPMLAAVGAVHHALIRAGKRMHASLVAETGEARDVHALACLLGYGAGAVHPWLALEAVEDLADRGELEGVSPPDAVAGWVRAAETGLLKIMSKMGISTLSAYTGAQIFETLGLGRAVSERCFSGTPARLGGVGFRELGEDALARHRSAWPAAGAQSPAPATALDEGGFFRFRRDGEPHAFSPGVAKALRKASETGSSEDWETYLRLSRGQGPLALRDLLRFRRTRTPLEVEEVEPLEALMARFAGGAMSLGALSPEAHETLAVAMNRFGGKSNTGEGGEDPRRFAVEDPLRNANSAIKQVASGRFGVTPAYLAAASELEIKIAQGSKPGEGGQLPGHKVSAYIAGLRHTVAGTPLVSPPPHHDIYSIEDLAQLIYDLKQANPRARVSVKLVAEEGVGTIAAGVAKGYADVIHVSGHEGGTGASPLSSIKHAGMPWELGLAEVQQVLVLNGLRDRVRLRTDGGLKSGRDVLVAALLGAEEFSFGTAALIALGCKMARQCHLNTCPVGIATQREDLRAKFRGAPEHAYNFFVHVAYELRALLAELGFRRLDEVIGRADLLEPDAIRLRGRSASLDVRALTWVSEDGRPLHSSLGRNLRPAPSFDDALLEELRPALDAGLPIHASLPVRSVHRAVGTRLSGEITSRFGPAGLPPGTVELRLEGSAGQSLGAFCAPGVRIVLAGEANDYVAKGMGGGEIAVRPSSDAAFVGHENVIAGNTVLYGATGGSLYVAGRAGERFAVRNSGARAVVEGVGDHGCEYMTEGVVVVLGETGRNFASGMSNGVAYVLDERGEFTRRVHDRGIAVQRLEAHGPDEELLLALIQRHVALTGSAHGRTVFSRWTRFRPRFWRVAARAALESGAMEELVRRHLEVVRLANAGAAAPAARPAALEA